MRPLGHPPCATTYAWKRSDSLWTECVQEEPLLLAPTGIDFPLTDWSKRKKEEMSIPHVPLRPTGPREVNFGQLPGSMLSTPQGMFHPELWKLVTAMGPVRNQDLVSGQLTLHACVPRPFLLVVGVGVVTSVRINDTTMYDIHCPRCRLTNCIPIDAMRWPRSPAHVFLVMQPPFVLLPVEIKGPWYANYGYQFAVELENHLRRPKRFIGLAIAGVTALISLIASATVSTVALSNTVHTATHVNQLSKNVSAALHIQQNIDQKILARLDGLEEAVEFLGSQLSILKTQMSLICHGAFQHICVTPLPATNYSWPKIQNHLKGIWHDANVSLDLLELQKSISAIGHAHLDIVNPSDLARSILHTMQGFNPGNMLQHTFWYLLGLIILLEILFAIWCCFYNVWKHFLQRVNAHLHFWQLKQKGGDVVSSSPRAS
ncbi:endogenous retrovirus group K member 13-1 Env polyprotein-like [Meles meles]|uniref:endogenous retrovirus group K member 13-1 Env polyprotein-like n=1 Tax=Meles meles TaxID=9662 RepID=UPI001E69E942|nr:endogenous retrovirus group K member 13-1 Env polyprotein-like [Meles meles]